MPLLKIQTSCHLEAAQKKCLLQRMSLTTAEALGKSENYVMVIVEDELCLSFAGNDELASAYLELKSIDLPEEQTASLSATLCQAMEAETGIASERIYIAFSNIERHLWGWNQETF